MNTRLQAVRWVVLLGLFITPCLRAGDVIEMGSRLELFVDDFMIQQMSGTATQVLHKPEPQEVVLVTDKPWEGNICWGYTPFEDGDRYKMYYCARHAAKVGDWGNMRGVAYAESSDGIHWKRPSLGRVKFDGYSGNNLINLPFSGAGFAPMKNDNPHAPRYAKYIATGWTSKGLELAVSANGLDWQLADPSVIPVKGAFDSQNTLFWDTHAKLYRCYYRVFKPYVGRAVMTCTSPDLKSWSEPVDLQYPSATVEELYTNAIQCYHRAPHILVGFPTIYLRTPQEQVAPEFMSSRDGVTFHRWTEKIIPLTAPKDRDGNRSNYMAYGFLELPSRPDEYSFYATEAYYVGTSTRLRRFTYRIDGFVSVSASNPGGEVLTKPLTFTGKFLVVNGVTKPGGSIRAEVLDEQGKPVAGKTLMECQPFTGDNIQHIIRWQNSSDISAQAGKPTQLRFVLQDADLYSFQFR